MNMRKYLDIVNEANAKIDAGGEQLDELFGMGKKCSTTKEFHKELIEMGYRPENQNEVRNLIVADGKTYRLEYSQKYYPTVAVHKGNKQQGNWVTVATVFGDMLSIQGGSPKLRTARELWRFINSIDLRTGKRSGQS